jgi:hypothetical protein
LGLEKFTAGAGIEHKSCSGKLSADEIEAFDEAIGETYPYSGDEMRKHRERVFREFLDNPDVPGTFLDGRQHRTPEQARLDYAWHRVAGRTVPQKESIREGTLYLYDDAGQYDSKTERFREALLEAEANLCG